MWTSFNALAHRVAGKIAIAIVLILCGSTLAEAALYRLQWDPNQDSTTAGYFVFYGTSRGVYQPTQGIDVGNVTEFQVDLTPGMTYYFMVKAYDTANVFGPASAEIEFMVPAAPSLAISSASPAPGSTITATAANGPGNSNDYVGLYAMGAANGSFLQRKYLNNSTSPGAALTGGAVTFTAPTTPGQYEARFVASTGTTLATSVPITVAAPSVTPSASNVVAGTALTATVANSPGTSTQDWVGFFPVNAGVNGFLYKKYLNDSATTTPATPMTSGVLSFTTASTLLSGSYNVRLISAAGATLASSGTITVAGLAGQIALNGGTTPVSAVTQSTVNTTVNVTGTNRPGDWVGLFAVGAGVGQQLDWRYLNGSQTRPATAVSNATISFPVPAPGAYEFRLFTNDTWVLVATSATLTSTAPATPAAQITVNGSAPPTAVSAGAGSMLTTNVAMSGSTYAGDWVGLFPVGGTLGQYIEWKYLNGTQTRPATGTSNATLGFTMPGPGNYELRLFSNDSGTLVATSSTLTSTQSATLAVNGVNAPATATVAAGATFTVAVSGGTAPSPTDWVALYPVGGTAGQWIQWKYMNGTQSAPGAGIGNATLSFTMPSGGGPYQVRLYSNNTVTLLATSANITLGQSAAVSVNGVTPPTPVVAAGGAVLTAGVSIQGPTFSGDWVGLFPVGGSTGQWIDWKYMNGMRTQPGASTTAATLTFAMPTVPGNYELRVYSNNTGTLLGTSTTLTPSQTAALTVNGTTAGSITTPTASALSINVSISGPTYAGDFAALYAVGAANSQFLEWKYMNGTTTRPASGTANASLTFTTPLAAGSYEIRLFSNDTFALIATAPTVHASRIQVNGIAPPSSTSAAANSVLTVQVDNPGAVFAGDWVSLHAVGAGVGQYIAWQYMNGTTTMPGSGMSSATLSFAAPAAAGTYELRLYRNNTGTLIGIGPRVIVP
jgi:hypothetical protein